MGEQLQAAMRSPVPVAPTPGLARRADTLVPARISALARWLERETFLVVLFAIYLIGLTWQLPHQIVSDTWMGLTFGREIVQHGLPTHDVLTVWAHGRTWVDQQWLGQL